MRVLYWDCFAGISGDMALGSLVDAGADPEALRTILSGLPVTGWTLEIGEEKRNGLRGTKVTVGVTGDQPHRRLPDIHALLDAAGLPAPVRENAAAVFERLAAAEAVVHGIAPDQVHFHEVGAVDTVVEIVGCAAALHLLKIDRVEVSPLPLGRGFVNCAHGVLPLPAPAVLELLRGFPTRSVDVEGELVTPTGAALAVTLAKASGPFPALEIDRIGYGAGTASFALPNLLRAVVGRAADPKTPEPGEPVVVLETALDDVNPEHCPFFLERLLEAGALDAHLTPLCMKKGRPGVKLTVLSRPDVWKRLVKEIIRETGTLGVRVRREDRVTLERQILRVETEYGPVRVKAALLDGNVVRTKPEYEDCRALALRHGVPVRTVTAAAELAAAELNIGRRT